MTFVLSNIGDISLGMPLDYIVDDFILYNSARACFVVFSYFGDRMSMAVGNQSDSSDLIKAIVNEFHQRGIEAEITSEEKYFGDVFQFDLIEGYRK